MIATRQGQPQAVELWALPPYVSTPPDADEILGQSAELHVIADQVLRWRQRLKEPAESHLDRLERFRYYATILARLDELLSAPEEDEFGLARPSHSGIEWARKITFQMANMGILAAPDDVSTDRDGCSRIAWTKEGRFLELVAPCEPSDPPYLYYSAGEEHYGIENDLSPVRVLEQMRWLEGAPAR